jgi:6-phosphogluconolactonase
LDNLIKIFPTPFELAERFAEELVNMIKEATKSKKNFSVALSGGSTPELLFSVLGDHFSNSVSWEFVHFFWGDERCVSPEDPESNYGMTRRKLLGKIDIPSANIHRIKGEENPEKEASRYSVEISDCTAKRNGMPVFDLIILGLGEDGHYASIFPGNNELLNSVKICEVAVHPVTLQKRITLTGRVINNADFVTFLVTGKYKADIVAKVINKSISSIDFPSSAVVPEYGLLTWFLDKDAASLL